MELLKRIFTNIWTDQKSTVLGAAASAVVIAVTTWNPAIGAVVAAVMPSVVGAFSKNP
jgi:hypothetical protein